MTMKNWIRKEVQEQLPLARFEVYKWGSILVFGAIVTAATKFLRSIGASSGPYFYGALFVVSCVAFWFSTRKIKHGSSTHLNPSSQVTNSFPALSTLVPGVPKPTFNAQEFFKRAYFSPLTAEAEKNIRIIANEREHQDPTAFLCRFIGVGLVGYLHENTWHTIYKSQLLMLHSMNTRNGYMPSSEARAFYDKVAAEHPAAYAKYPFEAWLNYIKQQGLILHHPGDVLEITWKGKDFLKYLTHWGFDINIKRL